MFDNNTWSTQKNTLILIVYPNHFSSDVGFFKHALILLML